MTRFLVLAVALASLLGVTALAVEVRMGTVKADVLNLRAGPSTSTASRGKAAEGDKVVVLGKTGNWYKVNYNGVDGYMREDYLTVNATEDYPIGTGSVTGSSVNVRNRPSTGAEPLIQLNRNATVEILGVEGGWYKIKTGDTTGYMHPDYVKVNAKSVGGASGAEQAAADNSGPDQNSDQRAEVVAYAKTFLGCSYKYGSMNGKTFDCSGFTSYVYKKFGYSLNRSSAGQLANGTKVERKDLRPGDIVIFRDPAISSAAASHVGIYVGNDQFIHCSSRGGGVKYNSLNDNYYNKYFIGGRRIIE